MRIIGFNPLPALPYSSYRNATEGKFCADVRSHRIGVIRIFTILLAVLLPSVLFAADVDDTLNGIFDARFKTLQVKVEGNDYAPPVITLGTDDRVMISFDELSEEHSYLRYSLVHCNANWQPSGLVDSEFIDGFNLGDVEEYEYSQLTKVHYVHYTIALPNDEVRFTVSGNYLLRVFPENDPENILLQARFMVSEAKAMIGASVTSRTDVDYNSAHQQLSLEVDASKLNVQDMYNDLKVIVSQNSRVDNEVVVEKPLRVSLNKAYYEHLSPLVFKAGNEYRRMETVSVTYPGMHIEEIGYQESYYYQVLETDKLRSIGQYLYDQTQFGRFTIREYNSSQSDIEADYVLTHFSLELPEQYEYGIFLDGDFTHRRFDPESRMVYNRATGLYEKSLLLKQGAYNYQYLAVPIGSMSGATAPIEGDFYETVNEYLVKVYYHRPGERYDRLVGVAVVYSGK